MSRRQEINQTEYTPHELHDMDLEHARSTELWDEAVSFVKNDEDMVEALQQVRDLHEENPDSWWAPYHFTWGMGFRNYLRDNGFGEEEFDVFNLDNIYVAIAEEAAGV